jgi:hypothetical protein
MEEKNTPSPSSSSITVFHSHYLLVGRKSLDHPMISHPELNQLEAKKILSRQNHG